MNTYNAFKEEEEEEGEKEEKRMRGGKRGSEMRINVREESKDFLTTQIVVDNIVLLSIA
jgi:hypothetical protein